MPPISSTGGGEVSETPNGVTTDGITQGPISSASPAAETPDAPYAVIGGKSFKDQAELTAWWDSRGNDTTGGADTGTDTATAAAGEDTLKGGQGNDAIVPTDDEIRANLQKAGGIFADPKYEPFALEFEKGGGKMLSDESLGKAAEAFGVPVDAVREFIQGQIASRQLQAAQSGQPSAEAIQTAQAIVAVVPDEADYRALLQWGKEGLTADERSAYDAALDRNDTATVKALLGSFQAKMNASGAGKGPRDVTSEAAAGGQGAAGGVQGYESSAQMQADMAKPEYRTDPAFRSQVEKRVAASKFS